MKFYIAAFIQLVLYRGCSCKVPGDERKPLGDVMESTLLPENPVKRLQPFLESGVHEGIINYCDDGKLACPFLMTCCIMANGFRYTRRTTDAVQFPAQFKFVAVTGCIAVRLVTAVVQPSVKKS